MYRTTLLVAIALMSFVSCSKERTTGEADHQSMGAHGMTSDWKFKLPQGDSVTGGLQ